MIPAEKPEKNQKPTQNRCVFCTSWILHHRHNQVLAIVCGLSRGSPKQYYKYEPHSVLEDSKLYTILWQVHNNW